MIVVAGAGIIGLACAWRLSQRGFEVTVFDAAAAAREASWAGAGMLAPGGEFSGEEPGAALALASFRQYPEFVRELFEETGEKIDFRRCGAVEVAFTDAEAEALHARAARQQAMGIPSSTRAYRGYESRHYPEDALVNPRDVTRALLEACRRAGVNVRERDPVLAIENGGNTVQAASGRHNCDGTLIAAGAWSSSLYPGLRHSFPVRGHLIGWQGKPAVAGPILRNAHTYIAFRSDGAVVAGSSSEMAGFDRTPDVSVVGEIKARVSKLLPEAPVESAEWWNGFRPGIEGDGPAIGRAGNAAVWLAYGHYRNGILMAPETARQIADLIASS